MGLAAGSPLGMTFTSIVSPEEKVAEWAVSEHEVAAPVIEQVRAVSALFLRSVNVHVLPAPGLPFTCTLKVENVPPPASLIWTFASTASPLK